MAHSHTKRRSKIVRHIFIIVSQNAVWMLVPCGGIKTKVQILLEFVPRYINYYAFSNCSSKPWCLFFNRNLSPSFNKCLTYWLALCNLLTLDTMLCLSASTKSDHQRTLRVIFSLMYFSSITRLVNNNNL